MGGGVMRRDEGSRAIGIKSTREMWDAICDLAIAFRPRGLQIRGNVGDINRNHVVVCSVSPAAALHLLG